MAAFLKSNDTLMSTKGVKCFHCLTSKQAFRVSILLMISDNRRIWNMNLYTLINYIKNTDILKVNQKLKSHFFFLSWVHRGQNLRNLQEDGERGQGTEWNNIFAKCARRLWNKVLPFSFRFCGEIDTSKVKPLYWTLKGNKGSSKTKSLELQTICNSRSN